MTPLRQRFIEDMQLRGYSTRTQEAYTRAVRQLAQRYHRSPDKLSEEDLRQYFLYLANEKKWARASTTIAEAKYSQWPASSPSRKASIGERSRSGASCGGVSV